MDQKLKQDAGNQKAAHKKPHSPPGSVDQKSEDSFPASDAPSHSPGTVGAPDEAVVPPPDSFKKKHGV